MPADNKPFSTDVPMRTAPPLKPQGMQPTQQGFRLNEIELSDAGYYDASYYEGFEGDYGYDNNENGQQGDECYQLDDMHGDICASEQSTERACEKNDSACEEVQNFCIRAQTTNRR